MIPLVQTLAPAVTASRLVVAHEAEEYADTMANLSIDVIRTGRGTGPIVTRVATFEHGTVTSTRVHFPMLGKASIGEDAALIIRVTSAPSGSRWSGIDLRPGTVLMYGPETPHTGITPDGFSFSFVALHIPTMEEAADRLGLTLNLPERGRARTLNPTPQVLTLARTLDFASDPFDSTASAEAHRMDTIPAAMAALSNLDAEHEAGVGARVDSRILVHVCIEYSEAIGRIPTISEMCLVAHVSERRLRRAFQDTFAMAPVRYFRQRFLTQARWRLLSEECSEQTVSNIASDLGFHNFGRFARHYDETYGELPSVTLQTAH